MTKRIPKPSAGKAGTGRFVARGRTAPAAKSAARSPVESRSDRTANEKPMSLAHRSVPATQAKNRFGEILQAVRDSGAVFIERHGQAQAVVLGIDAYNRLTSNERSSQERELDYWTREFDALQASMQTDKARKAVNALFSATDDELNRKRSSSRA